MNLSNNKKPLTWEQVNRLQSFYGGKRIKKGKKKRKTKRVKKKNTYKEKEKHKKNK